MEMCNMANHCRKSFPPNTLHSCQMGISSCHGVWNNGQIFCGAEKHTFLGFGEGLPWVPSLRKFFFVAGGCWAKRGGWWTRHSQKTALLTWNQAPATGCSLDHQQRSETRTDPFPLASHPHWPGSTKDISQKGKPFGIGKKMEVCFVLTALQLWLPPFL